MSTQPPPTSAERLAARQQATASTTKQLVVLAAGLVGAATIAGILGTVSGTSNPLWVIPVIISGFVCFLGLLSTGAWTAQSRILGKPAPRVTSGVFIAAVLFVGGLVALARDTPALAYVIPLAAAALVALLSALSGFLRRARGAREVQLRQGSRVVGTVKDDGLAEFPDTPNLKLATITVSFRDHSGVERWVRVLATQSPGHPIAVNDTVDVWFDPSSPGDISRIIVEHDNGASRISHGKPITSGS